MPIFAALMQSLFGALAVFLGRFFAANVAVKLAAVGALVGFAGALMLLFNGLIAPLVGQAFATSYGQVIGLAFPPIAGTCMATYAAVWVGCGLYGLQRRATAILAS